MVSCVTLFLIENSYFVHFLYLYLHKCQEIRIPSQWRINHQNNTRVVQIGYGTLLLTYLSILNCIQVCALAISYSLLLNYFGNNIEYMQIMTNIMYIGMCINCMPTILGILFLIDSINRHGIKPICQGLLSIIFCCKCQIWVNWTHQY